jgi:hypothetical protein
MGNIFARLQTTSESIIGAIVVVLNLIRLVQQQVLILIKLAIYRLVTLLVNCFIKHMESNILSEAYLDIRPLFNCGISLKPLIRMNYLRKTSTAIQ